MQQDQPHNRPAWRLLLASGVSLAVVMGAWLLPSYGGPNGAARTPAQKSYQAAAKAAVDAQIATMLDQGTIWLPNGTHLHTNGASVKDGKVSFDPAEKNAIARTGTETGDPTTAAEAKINRAAAERQRNSAEPKLVAKQIFPARKAVAQNRYAMANGCYAIRNNHTGRYLSYVGSNPRFGVKRRAYASPIFFKPTDLGTYLLWTKQSTMLSNQRSTLITVAKPGPKAVWTITGPRYGVYRASTTTKSLTSLRFERTTGCKAFPEASVNVIGLPRGGATTQQETRGYIDAHTHGMAFEFLGGMVHCGKPWDQYGVTVAMRDCIDHEVTGGKGAAMEGFLSGDLDGHDPVGWPTFKDWPAPQSLTHEGTYYKWMERSWRGGQRVLVNLLVENNQLCTLYPLKKNSCDDMDSIELQARDMHKLERYIDAQSGGPGKGWYRIVTNPDQARKVINAGKFAVIMGIETSVPFKCSQKLGIPQCNAKQIDGWLDKMRKMGVSQMELVNKFDNALSGVAGDEGTTGILVNAANTLETLSPWRMRTCNPNDPEVHDKNQYSTPIGVPAEQQDALFGAVLKFSGVNLPSLPIYPPINHCNAMGLTSLGEHVIKGLAKRNMLFDPDHMSVKARKASLDLVDRLQAAGTPIGVLSSHSWSTVDAYPRIYKEKGFITPYAGDSDGFVAKWKRHLNWANPKTYWGIGFGADINGLGAQGNPRANNKNPVTYPFKGFGGVTINKQVAGKRVYDINKDGVAQYGLYPDWIEDLRKQAGSAIVKDMARGPEAYLQVWERAYGIRPDSCSNGNRLTAKKILGVKRGTTSWNVLKQLGQPHRRLGTSYTYCSTGGVVKVYFAKDRVTSAKRV